MISNKKINQNWKKIKSQLREAERFLEEEKLDEALYFVWLAAENIVNNLKVSVNGFYLKDHKEKSYVLKKYFVENRLRKDYSKLFRNLSKYRIVAEFHPYTSIPKDYNKKDIVNYLSEIKNLKNEVEKILLKKKILK